MTCSSATRPFLRIQRISAKHRTLYRERFASARGKFDAANCFVELGLRLLAPGGVLAFVLPGRLLTTAHGQSLLELLQREARIFLKQDISPESDTAISEHNFESASYACLLGLRREDRTTAENGRGATVRTSGKSRETMPLGRVCESIFQGRYFRGRQDAHPPGPRERGARPLPGIFETS